MRSFRCFANTDIKRVVKNIGVTKESLQLSLWKERKKEREERRRRTAEEELQRCATQEKLRERDKQLEEERKVSTGFHVFVLCHSGLILLQISDSVVVLFLSLSFLVTGFTQKR